MTEVFQNTNWIDLLIVILLIRSSYVGFTKGFGWELFRFVGYIATVLSAIYYYEFVSQLISDYFPVISSFSNLVSFSGIYLAILFIFKFINLLLEKVIKIETFSTIERIGGLLLGFLRGVILTSLLLISLVFTPVPYFEKSVKERSYSGQVVVRFAPFLYEEAALVFPALKFGQRNEALSKLTDLKEGLFIFYRVKGNTSGQKRGLLRGDIEAY